VRKAVLYGVRHIGVTVLVLTAGCAVTGGKPIQSGPARADQAIAGDLTNANVSINDWRMVVGLCVCGMVSIAGFYALNRKLVTHHASLARVITGTPGSTADSS